MNKPLAITALAACLALAGCGNNTDESMTAADETVDAGVDSAAETADQMGDAMTDPMDPNATGAMAGQTDAMGGAMVNPTEEERAALGMVNAVNELEITASNQALQNNVSGEVAEYARMMVTEHTANREKTNAMNPQMDAPMVAEQKTKGEAMLEQLEGQEGDGYEKAYVEMMVKSHTDALAALEDKLIPAATTPEVQAHLTATRDAVAKHLERAQALQGGS